MAGKILGLVAISVMLTSVLLLGILSDQQADAKTSKESPKHKFSKWSKKVWVIISVRKERISRLSSK